MREKLRRWWGRRTRIKTLPASAGKCPSARGKRHVIDMTGSTVPGTCLLCGRIVL